jgi:hypothetical protein
VQDAVLDAWRAAIEERILALTGFSFTGGVMTEQQIDVQLGVNRFMQFRPLLPVVPGDPLKSVVLKARSLASSTFNDILGDIRDPFKGLVVPLASELTPVFPPIGGVAPWLRWRQMIWPVVLFTYNVDPLGSTTNPVPTSLNRAVVEWAASIYAHPGAGRIKSFTAEKISETYNMMVMPKIVEALIGRYIRTQIGLNY